MSEIQKEDRFKIIYRWIQLKINEKYIGVDAKVEFRLGELENGKVALRFSFSQETLDDPSRHEYLKSLLPQLESLTTIQDVKDEIDELNRQGNEE